MELKIDDNNLSKELSEQAANLAFVSEEAIAADLKFNEFKLKVEELAALIDASFREKSVKEGNKITEKMVENAITTNEEYKTAKIHLMRLKAQADLLKAKRDAWQQRGSMLVQLSTNRRAEMEALSFETVKAVGAL